ncbi:TetR/AcrR family transcriptional regulator [Mucilaginibacter sp. NFX135]|uniref:TetR/AcrR family transcriptional regulator n=1 Tax=Mucilaginibacter sp. NFX135 TaxID=3402687 RepID=UPI003AFB1D7D
MRLRNTDKEELVKQKAIELIIKDGLEGFSMNKLARACNISVATPYIYYKDRDDLIMKVAMEELRVMEEAFIKDFDPEEPFEQGLRKQWENRYRYARENPKMNQFFDQLRSSSYQEEFLSGFMTGFISAMTRFMHNITARGEIETMPFEVYWSIAFGTLYNLIRFDMEGKSLSGKPFKMTDEILWRAFDLVVKSLKK